LTGLPLREPEPPPLAWELLALPLRAPVPHPQEPLERAPYPLGPQELAPQPSPPEALDQPCPPLG